MAPVKSHPTRLQSATQSFRERKRATSTRAAPASSSGALACCGSYDHPTLGIGDLGIGEHGKVIRRPSASMNSVG